MTHLWLNWNINPRKKSDMDKHIHGWHKLLKICNQSLMQIESNQTTPEKHFQSKVRNRLFQIVQFSWHYWAWSFGNFLKCIYEAWHTCALHRLCNRVHIRDAIVRARAHWYASVRHVKFSSRTDFTGPIVALKCVNSTIPVNQPFIFLKYTDFTDCE